MLPISRTAADAVNETMESRTRSATFAAKVHNARCSPKLTSGEGSVAQSSCDQTLGEALEREGRARTATPRLESKGGDFGGRGLRRCRAPANLLTTTFMKALCFCIHELVGAKWNSLRASFHFEG